jgi:hypothetical protein
MNVTEAVKVLTSIQEVIDAYLMSEKNLREDWDFTLEFVVEHMFELEESLTEEQAIEAANLTFDQAKPHLRFHPTGAKERREAKNTMANKLLYKFLTEKLGPDSCWLNTFGVHIHQDNLGQYLEKIKKL